MSFSASDKTFLNLLQKNAVIPKNELIEQAGMSGTTLWRKIQEFESNGLIRKRVTLLDPDIAGLSVCIFVSINLANYTPEARTSFEQFVERTPKIMECFSVTGSYDYTLIVREESVSSFERLLMHEILTHPSVASATSQIALKCQKYSTELPL